MIQVRPYEDFAAHAVLSRLDPMDQLEAEVVRGGHEPPLAIFADWRAANAARLISTVLLTDVGTPFAVLGLSHTGQAGVAQAALLARDHTKFRRPLAEAALRIRKEMPVFAEEFGVHRIETRSWVQHPSGARLLVACGFHLEATMPGFGPLGDHAFHQFAWVAPYNTPAPEAPDLKTSERT
ncbi:hypothetical protein DEM26_08985 [Thioclava sp. NG1]|uniref:hypothetical protein n=1 Tax=Thioclava sp. NG1 TaxID=2182426 RepID=UPI000D611B3E|nr:hypothetical protein [Thioclava sp. NG1]PWE50075.1 hypothetical protein DEM26_08985 [Thioclava sp. NG1]